MKHIIYILILLLLVVIFGIAIKRHHYGQLSDSCLSVRKAALEQTPKHEGTYIPQCSIFGNYIPQQCNQSTGECWCVMPNGQEIAGTRVSAGNQPTACPITWLHRFYRKLQ